MHASVYGADEPHLLGNLDVWKSKGDWSSLIICPSRDHSNKDQEKHLLLSGTPNLAFKVQVDSSVEEIVLNKPLTFDLGQYESIKVFQFIPTKDISDMQLDVTVTSESDLPTYLKVSRDCKDVNENIDVVDYKGKSIRLSFAKKGRITLSRVSIPPLTDSTSSWFIGIAIKYAKRGTRYKATKTVTLTLKRSFDYSYFWPIFLLVVLSVVLGAAVACCGILCFLIDSNGTHHSSPSSTEGNGRANDRSNSMEMSPVQATTPIQPDEKTPLISTSKRTVIEEVSEAVSSAEPDAVPQATTPSTQTSQRGVMEEVSEVVSNWFKRGPKTYSYITGIVGFVFVIVAGQFVFADWHLMIQEGDRDTCYYNDFCYRVSKYDDIPFNLMISNLTYMIHGLILAISVMYMEAKLFSRYRNSNDLPPQYAFSMGYAFAWALFFEGCFSLVYHLCPSKLTFQLDTGFMFVIAGLIIVLLYNGIERKKELVGVANFFLYFLVPLYMFNYLGTLSHSETALVNAPAFFTFAAIWWILITCWTGWKVFPDFIPIPSNGLRSHLCRYLKEETVKCLLFGFGFVLPVILYWVFSSNIPETFLFTCIAEDILAIIGYVCCNWKEIKWAKWAVSKCKVVIQGLYILFMIILWFFAALSFLGYATTDKSLTPERSRDYNQECIFLNFFDAHDVWHILSSHALLMTVYFVMFMSRLNCHDPISGNSI